MITLSLKYKPEKKRIRQKPNIKSPNTWRRQRRFDTRPNDQRSNDVLGLKRVRRSLDWDIVSILDKNLRELLLNLTKSKLQMTESSPVFRTTISRIEKNSSLKMDVKRFFISNSIKYCFIGVKLTTPKLKAFEKIVEGVLTKDVKKIGAGVVATLTNEIFSTVLLELIDSE